MNHDAEFGADLAALEGAYSDGNKHALLEIMLHCAIWERPLPVWAREAFFAGYQAVMAGEARSWDELFGKPHRGRHVRTVKANARAYEIHRRVRDLHEREGMPVDEALFERVANETGIGKKTLVSDLYYWIENARRRIATTSGK
jgi:hypothetical protein